MTGGWVLATDRLTIRPVEAGDAEAMFAVRNAMPFDPPKRDLKGTRAMIAGMVAVEPGSRPGWAGFAIVDQKGSVIGDIGVEFDGPGPRQAEIGFALDPDARGRGLATEAVGRMVEHLLGQVGLHRLAARTDIRNLPTQRRLKRLRFRQEAHFVRSWAEGDAWFDELAFARLAGE